MSSIGIIVNPHAGKDIRRLAAAASHTSDAAKIGIVRRVALAAGDVGVDKILLSPDRHRLSERAVEKLGLPTAMIEGDPVGARMDSIHAAERMQEHGADVVVVLGGDGTCRDIATGWSGAPMVAISTGTNNVYPSAVDATSAGTAAALVATGVVALETASTRTKQIDVVIDEHGDTVEDLALVDLAMIDTSFVGARAVLDASSIRTVVAAVAHPASTGLSSIAGRSHPVTQIADSAAVVHLGAATRRVRVPLSPGAADVVDIASVEAIGLGEQIELRGPGVLAFDGERDRPVADGTVITATVRRNGPHLIDVARAMASAAEAHFFDEPMSTDHEEGPA